MSRVQEANPSGEYEPKFGGTVNAADQPGDGSLRFSWVAGQTAITRCRNAAPMKWLTPRRNGPAAWAYASTFGGGLVAGDRVRIQVEVESQAVGVVTTQASTKVFHQQDGNGATQELNATVDDDGLLLVLPDPLTCFADAIYTQVQRFTLAPRGSLVLLDWFTCGRGASGERWAFESYDSLNVVSVAGREVMFDRTKLGRSAIAAHPRLSVGGYEVLANVYLVGPAVRPGVESLEAWIKEQPIDDAEGWRTSFSPAEWGGTLRLAGRDVQTLTTHLRERLHFIHPFTGGCPWERKW